MTRIVIDPITRIEGHMKVEAVVDDGEVKEARSGGMLFRGFEIILEGRDPRDAARYTQRVCGVCPASHANASSLNLDSAFGIADRIPHNGRLLRNLILGCNYLQSHILHFYHLAALDYVDVTAAADYKGDDSDLNSIRNFISRGTPAPFMPRYEGDYRLTREENRAAASHYVKALQMRKLAHEALAVFGGKMPHNASVVAGGCTCEVTEDKIVSFLGKINALSEFVNDIYIPDVLMVARRYDDYFGMGRGCGNYLAYGAFDLDGNPDLTKRERFLPCGTANTDLQLGTLDPSKITEKVRHSWFEDSCAAHPAEGDTIPNPDKDGGYSWIKSPRYDGMPHEVGPLARAVVAYLRGHERLKPMIDGVLSEFNAEPTALFSVLGRHAARALESKVIADAMKEWVLQLKPGEPTCAVYDLPETGEGMGLVGAPRGALGHWIRIRDRKVEKYQMVVPTTWNAGPADDKGRPGPIEQALIGTKIKDVDNPFEIVRIVRSFDPCLACAVHVVTLKGRKLGEYRIA